MKLLQKEYFKPDIKPIKKMGFINQKTNKIKVLTSSGSRTVKIAQNFFSKYLKDSICKIKQYLNYILMMISQNILAILKIFLNLLKKFMNNLTPRRQLPKLLPMNSLAKLLTEIINLCEAKISLDEFIKSTNSQTNNKSPGNKSLIAELYKHFFNKLAPVLLDIYDSWGKLGNMGVPYRT